MTKMFIFVLAFATLAGMAPAQTTKTPRTPSAKSAAAKRDPSLPKGVPDGAKSYKPYYWRWVDAKGVGWIYHTTPFGVVHDQETLEDRAEMASIKAKVPSTRPAVVPGEVTIVDKGDSLEFTRQMPFGPSRWTVKKTELTQEDAAAWAREQAAKQRAQQ